MWAGWILTAALKIAAVAIFLVISICFFPCGLMTFFYGMLKFPLSLSFVYLL